MTGDDFATAWAAVEEAWRARDADDGWGKRHPNERLSIVLRGNPESGWTAYYGRDRVLTHESPEAALHSLAGRVVAGTR